METILESLKKEAVCSFVNAAAGGPGNRKLAFSVRSDEQLEHLNAEDGRNLKVMYFKD